MEHIKGFNEDDPEKIKEKFDLVKQVNAVSDLMMKNKEAWIKEPDGPEKERLFEEGKLLAQNRSKLQEQLDRL